ncbi:hypothetical protein Hanom_Chr12g01079981 [Helianthus anomalus]
MMLKIATKTTTSSNLKPRFNKVVGELQFDSFFLTSTNTSKKKTTVIFQQQKI